MAYEALLQLADILEANANNEHGAKFDLCTIGTFDPSEIAPAMNCGTTACGMGIAALSGAFPRLGYTIKRFDDEAQIQCTIDGDECGYLGAAMTVFGLNVHEARILFDPQYSSRPNEGREGELALVSDIRTLVERKIARQHYINE